MINKRGAASETSWPLILGGIVGVVVLAMLLYFFTQSIVNSSNTTISLAGLNSVDTIRNSCNNPSFQQGSVEYCDKIRKAEFPDKRVLFGSCFNLKNYITGINELDCADNLKTCGGLGGVWSVNVCGKTGAAGTTDVSGNPKVLTGKVENSEGHNVKKEYCCGAVGCQGIILSCAQRNVNNCETDGKINCELVTTTINGVSTKVCNQVNPLVIQDCEKFATNVCPISLGCVLIQ